MKERLEATLSIEGENIVTVAAERNTRGSLSGLQSNWYEGAMKLSPSVARIDSSKIKNTSQLLNVLTRIGESGNPDNYKIKANIEPYR